MEGDWDANQARAFTNIERNADRRVFGRKVVRVYMAEKLLSDLVLATGSFAAPQKQENWVRIAGSRRQYQDFRR